MAAIIKKTVLEDVLNSWDGSSAELRLYAHSLGEIGFDFVAPSMRLGTYLTADNARRVAQALIEHADALDAIKVEKVAA